MNKIKNNAIARVKMARVNRTIGLIETVGIAIPTKEIYSEDMLGIN